jgi:hypothetical protein
MLRIIVIILLCSILVLSNSNLLKGIAIIALLLQAYSDIRGKKIKEQFLPSLIDNKKVNSISLKLVDLVFKNNKECLNKKQFLEKIKGEDFKKQLTSLAFSEFMS